MAVVPPNVSDLVQGSDGVFREVRALASGIEAEGMAFTSTAGATASGEAALGAGAAAAEAGTGAIATTGGAAVTALGTPLVALAAAGAVGYKIGEVADRAFGLSDKISGLFIDDPLKPDSRRGHASDHAQAPASAVSSPQIGKPHSLTSGPIGPIKGDWDSTPKHGHHRAGLKAGHASAKDYSLSSKENFGEDAKYVIQNLADNGHLKTVQDGIGKGLPLAQQQVMAFQLSLKDKKADIKIDGLMGHDTRQATQRYLKANTKSYANGVVDGSPLDNIARGAMREALDDQKLAANMSAPKATTSAASLKASQAASTAPELSNAEKLRDAMGLDKDALRIEKDPQTGIEYAVIKAKGAQKVGYNGPISSPDQKAALSPILGKAGMDPSAIDTSAYQQSIRIPTSAITDGVVSKAGGLKGEFSSALNPAPISKGMGMGMGMSM